MRPKRPASIAALAAAAACALRRFCLTTKSARRPRRRPAPSPARPPSASPSASRSCTWRPARAQLDRLRPDAGRSAWPARRSRRRSARASARVPKPAPRRWRHRPARAAAASVSQTATSSARSACGAIASMWFCRDAAAADQREADLAVLDGRLARTHELARTLTRDRQRSDIATRGSGTAAEARRIHRDGAARRAPRRRRPTRVYRRARAAYNSTIPPEPASTHDRHPGAEARRRQRPDRRAPREARRDPPPGRRLPERLQAPRPRGRAGAQARRA